MKIILTIHHFPPNYSAGAEVYTFRLAGWLMDHGYDVEVVCVESITHNGNCDLEHTHEIFKGISVWRLYFNLKDSPDPFYQSFENELIGDWFEAFLRQQRPDVVHINSCYLLSISTIRAAKQLSIPIVLTLHDFWFICPRIILLRPTGEICTVPENPTECVWCLATEKRRFRWIHRASGGTITSITNPVLSTSIGTNLLGISPNTEQILQRRKLLIQALNLADYILSPSQFLRDLFVGQGISEEKIVYSRISLDTSYWEDPGDKPPASTDVLRICYIGQLSPHKGVHLLLEAFNKLVFTNHRRATLKIYGNPHQFPDYSGRLQKIGESNPDIIFAGHFENRKIAKILQTCDVTVAPSLWYENSPIAIMESLTLGTPVVAANLGGMPELVRHNVNGLLFETGNVTDLTTQLQKLIDDPQLVDSLSRQADPVRDIDDEMNYVSTIYHQVVSN